MLHFIQDQLTMPATESMRVSVSLVAEIKFNVFHWLMGHISMYFIGCWDRVYFCQKISMYLNFIGCWDRVKCISLVVGTELNVFHWLLGQS